MKLRVFSTHENLLKIANIDPSSSSSKGHDGYKALLPLEERLNLEAKRQDLFSFAMQERQSFGWCVDGVEPAAVFYDFDGTFICEESLVELAALVHKTEDVRLITESAMRGEIDFKESLLRRLNILAGLNADCLKKVLARLHFECGILETVKQLKIKGSKVFIVSGGFHEIIEAMPGLPKLDGICANRLSIENGALTGRLNGPLIDAEAKAVFVRETCVSLGLDLNRVIAVGDGANDRTMMRVAGIKVGFKPKATLWDEVQMVLGKGDHEDLMGLFCRSL